MERLRDAIKAYLQQTIESGEGCDIILHMTAATKNLLERLASWPQEDVKKLDEVAREIEAQRTGVYHATPEELRALDEAERSGIASEAEVEAAFRTFRKA